MTKNPEDKPAQKKEIIICKTVGLTQSEWDQMDIAIKNISPLERLSRGKIISLLLPKLQETLLNFQKPINLGAVIYQLTQELKEETYTLDTICDKAAKKGYDFARWEISQSLRILARKGVIKIVVTGGYGRKHTFQNPKTLER